MTTSPTKGILHPIAQFHDLVDQLPPGSKVKNNTLPRTLARVQEIRKSGSRNTIGLIIVVALGAITIATGILTLVALKGTLPYPLNALAHLQKGGGIGAMIVGGVIGVGGGVILGIQRNKIKRQKGINNSLRLGLVERILEHYKDQLKPNECIIITDKNSYAVIEKYWSTASWIQVSSKKKFETKIASLLSDTNKIFVDVSRLKEIRETKTES